MYKDLDAALVCVALRMGKQPETGLLLDKRVPTNDVNVLIVSYLDLFTQFIAIYKSSIQISLGCTFLVITGHELHTVLLL